MGVPKFFRYISERYPCLSETVKEYQLPEFDNLYLDMNGIIHMCSHPDDNNPHFRITEEKIFQDIFHYIEVLFRMIRPQKLFFMAVDGVAPRAKMNQQRGRRFRSAKDAEKMIKQAVASGEQLPDVARFDSNCITPGTEFMYRLHEQLKYFVVNKISNDPLWNKCKVILSGHETPGEGEHKIMDYIRYMRAQPGYDPNTRHCLYGLDADLIMLGLCTHEPHFSLLREEVKFGRKTASKRMSVPEEITFYLLHLSLMREYLELEFKSLESKLEGFEYDFEKIIDDWVLMGFLVGNDFIPHLPNLHIEHGALPLLYKTYGDVLPELGGYINEGGSLNLERFQKFMKKLADVDLDNFEDYKDDMAYMESKTGRKFDITGATLKPENLQAWKPDDGEFQAEALEPESVNLAHHMGYLQLDETDNSIVKHSIDIDVDNISDDEDLFEMFKRNYYRNKMAYINVTEEVMKDQAEGYVRAIQWNLNYYYNGCCSWSWYYPHHYAPYISDIKNFSNMKITFDLGVPFKPYEQLLAVLPPGSKNLLPSAYHELMVNENSVIKEYYPEEFATDLNGKRQEWEAVVLVPFIDENLLLEAMKTCNEKLTEEEKNRNNHGPMLIYSFTHENLGKYTAPEYFSTIGENHAILQMVTFEDIRISQENLVKGAYPGVRQNVYYPGFPTMKHLKYEGSLHKAKVNVFDQPSRNENMIVKILFDEKINDSIPTNLLGTTIFIGWPHLVEAKLVAISTPQTKYVTQGGPGEFKVEDKPGNNEKSFHIDAEGICERYKNKLGIECGETKVLLHTKVIIGRRYIFTDNGRISLNKEFATMESLYPLQTAVFNITAFDSCNSTFRNVEDLFPVASECFTITNPYYGSKGQVLDSTDSLKNGRLRIAIDVDGEPDLSSVWQKHRNNFYMNTYKAAQILSMPTQLFSKITGCVFITARNNEGGLKNVNGGLDLKFNKKNKETPGYTRKNNNSWLYSSKAVELVREYAQKFPDIVHYINRESQKNVIDAEEIYGEQWEEKLKELTTYLKELPTVNIKKRTCGSQVFDKELTEDIENIVDNFNKTKVCKNIVISVKPAFLYKPEVQSGTCLPDKSMQAEILDRIINVRIGFTVPYGLKGTIIAINESSNGNDREVMYDIVFDEKFDGGLALNCTDGRGYTLPATAFINISHGKRLMELKTGKPAEFIAKATEPSQMTRKNSAFAQFSQPQNNQNMQNNFMFPSFNSNPTNLNPMFQNLPKVNQATNYGNQMTNITILRKPHNVPSINEQSKPRNLNKPKEQAPTNTQPVESNANVQERNPKRVDTAMLKAILKISNEEPSLKPERAHISPSTDNQINITELISNTTKTSATVQLLTYYQSNRLGCPRYQYMTNENGGIVAHLRLPNNKTVFGQVSPNKEAASRSVAEEALKVLLNKGSNDEGSFQATSSFPNPPQNWVLNGKSQMDNPNRNNMKHYQNHQSRGHYDYKNSSFVPTQAIKRNAMSRGSASNYSPQKPGRDIPTSQSNISLKENKTGINHSRKKTDRPNGQRKPRIAANFSNNS